MVSKTPKFVGNSYQPKGQYLFGGVDLCFGLNQTVTCVDILVVLRASRPVAYASSPRVNRYRMYFSKVHVTASVLQLRLLIVEPKVALGTVDSHQ